MVAFALATRAWTSCRFQRGDRERMLKLKSGVPMTGSVPRQAYVKAVEMAPAASRCTLCGSVRQVSASRAGARASEREHEQAQRRHT